MVVLFILFSLVGLVVRIRKPQYLAVLGLGLSE